MKLEYPLRLRKPGCDLHEHPTTEMDERSSMESVLYMQEPIAHSQKSCLILALFTGAFDKSSAVFLICKKVYLSYPTFFMLETLYRFYHAFPLLIAVIQVLVMPAESYLAFLVK